MRVIYRLIAGVGCSLVLGAASAGVSQQAAGELGKSLTLSGAEQAGSADHVIPAYTDGLPLNTNPPGWKKSSGRYDVGPYDNEKPIFSINSGNVDKYAEHLTAGTISLIKRYPSYRVDVYPTHRSVSYSEDYLAACKGNATGSTIHPDGNGIDGSPHMCVPFPIPQSGVEVIWNSLLANKNGIHSEQFYSTYLVDGNEHLTDAGHVLLDYGQPYLDPNKNTPLEDGVVIYNITTYDGPPSQVGTKILIQDPTDFDKSGIRVWVYTPGQRRTRLAPEFSYDTPISAVGGSENYDEVDGFQGAPDRYDFKLVGKKEIYVPYNANRLMFAPVDKVLSGKILNPDVTRWELHRVWVVEATLKPGKRHVEPRRTFYVDEDSWAVVASDAYDAAGKMFKVGFFPIVPIWDEQSYIQGNIYYDLSRQNLFFGLWNRPGDYAKFSGSVGYGRYTASALTSSGIR